MSDRSNSLGVYFDLDDTFWDEDHNLFENVQKYIDLIFKKYHTGDNNQNDIIPTIYFVTARIPHKNNNLQKKMEQFFKYSEYKIVIEYVRLLSKNSLPRLEYRIEDLLIWNILPLFNKSFKEKYPKFNIKMIRQLKTYKDIYYRKLKKIILLIHSRPFDTHLVLVGDTEMVDIFVLLGVAFLFTKGITTNLLWDDIPLERVAKKDSSGIKTIQCHIKSNDFELNENELFFPFDNYPWFSIFKNYDALIIYNKTQRILKKNL